MNETVYTYNVKIKFDTEENKNFWHSLLSEQKVYLTMLLKYSIIPRLNLS